MIELSKNISSCRPSDLPVKANNGYFDPILTPYDFMSKLTLLLICCQQVSIVTIVSLICLISNAYFYGNTHVLDLAVIFVTSSPLGFVFVFRFTCGILCALHKVL